MSSFWYDRWMYTDARRKCELYSGEQRECLICTRGERKRERDGFHRNDGTRAHESWLLKFNDGREIQKQNNPTNPMRWEGNVFSSLISLAFFLLFKASKGRTCRLLALGHTEKDCNYSFVILILNSVLACILLSIPLRNPKWKIAVFQGFTQEQQY